MHIILSFYWTKSLYLVIVRGFCLYVLSIFLFFSHFTLRPIIFICWRWSSQIMTMWNSWLLEMINNMYWSQYAQILKDRQEVRTFYAFYDYMNGWVQKKHLTAILEKKKLTQGKPVYNIGACVVTGTWSCHWALWHYWYLCRRQILFLSETCARIICFYIFGGNYYLHICCPLVKISKVDPN